ncbi:MAG: DUF4956 domain-containing protein [Clostridia bacterium]|nr:DUF4956 domain-containing protein [Clostridia bacterium]
MLNEIFKGLFDSLYSSVITPEKFLLCIGVALLLGIILAAAYAFRARFTKSFLMTMAVLPAIVCVVIMMVNGNIGAGVAVAGAFSLVRFRSAPGSAREIAAIFLAMGTGLVCGMGYLGFAALFAVIMSLILIICNLIDYHTAGRVSKHKSVRITIPEDLDYTTVFDDIFEEYTARCELVKVKTTNMGSMFRLTYNLTLRDAKREKEFIDKLRTRNGNLEIMVSKEESASGEL